MPSRKESLLAALPHILPQVDRLYLYLDKYDEIPREIRAMENIIPILPSAEFKSKGCTGKLYGLKIHKAPCLYFCFDDDIIYQNGYVDHLSAALSRYHYESIVGLHGCIFKNPARSYVKDRQIIGFSAGLHFDVLVDELGSGTIAFHSEAVRLEFDYWSNRNMTDLYVMIEAIRQKVNRICIRRSPDFIKAIRELQEDSIWRNSMLDDALQSRLLQSIMNEYPDNWGKS